MPQPPVADSALSRPHWRRRPESSRISEEPSPSPPPSEDLQQPLLVPQQQVPNCLDDKYPVGTRVETRWGDDPTWWPGVVVHSDIYSPRSSAEWLKRDRRVRILYDGADIWGTQPYVHLLSMWGDSIRLEGGLLPSAPAETVPNIPPPAKPPAPPPAQGTRRSSRLAKSTVDSN